MIFNKFININLFKIVFKKIFIIFYLNIKLFYINIYIFIFKIEY